MRSIPGVVLYTALLCMMPPYVLAADAKPRTADGREKCAAGDCTVQTRDQISTRRRLEEQSERQEKTGTNIQPEDQNAGGQEGGERNCAGKECKSQSGNEESQPNTPLPSR
jgi:hypothetical protein